MSRQRPQTVESSLVELIEPEEARFLVFNVTDGVMAWPELLTLGQAKRFVRQFPVRCAHPGYDLTASWHRIPPDAVAWEIVDAGTGLSIGQDWGPESAHGGDDHE